MEGAIRSSNPASILQMHPTAKIYLDEKSASKLARRDYYRWVFDNKPDWQRGLVPRKPGEDSRAVAALPVHMLGGEPALAAHGRELLGERDQRQEHERLPVTVFDHHICDAPEVGFDGVGEVVRVEVARSGPD